MPIVLAIEPDRRQAAHLLAIVRQQVGAELVLADTTEGALDAIGDRVPDLVLVPALLSPQDDAALAAALRVIAAAAHVRTLTIPVLANGVRHETPGGILAKWRRGRAASPEPEGCEPAVFGEQISAYLQEAAAERAELEDELPDEMPIAVAAAPPPLPVPDLPVPAVPELPTPMHVEPPPVEAHVEPPSAEAHVEPPPAEAIEPWAASPIEQTKEIDETDENEIEPLIDLSDELEELSEDEDEETELFDGDPVGVYTISAEADEPGLDEFDLLSAILEPEPVAEPVAAAATVAADVEPAPAVEPAFDEPPEPPRPDIAPWVPMFLTPGRMWPVLEGMPAEVPAARTEQPDWIELVASLRQDLERRRTEPPSAAPAPIAARPSDGANADAHRVVKRQKTVVRQTKPVQDEWGFFDPEQCGFSTLLAKLDEITDDARR